MSEGRTHRDHSRASRVGSGAHGFQFGLKSCRVSVMKIESEADNGIAICRDSHNPDFVGHHIESRVVESCTTI